eukprot:scaffold3077_cov162-Amphora_coffeaeformis.AAC.30
MIVHDEVEEVANVLEVSLFSPATISRQQTRLIVGGSTAVLFLLYRLACSMLRRQHGKKVDDIGRKKDKLSLLHKSSHGITNALNERDRNLLLAWIRIHCHGSKEEMDLLGSLLWYRLLNSAPFISLPEKFPTMSWLGVLLWASTTSCSSWPPRSPLPGDQQILLKRIVVALGMCHVQDLVWPDCAIDTLVLHALVASSETWRRQISREILAGIRGQLILLGILKTDDSETGHGNDFYKTLDIISWDDGAYYGGQRSFDEASWVSQFVDALEAVVVLRSNDSSRASKIQPSSLMERSQLCHTLTVLLVHLGMEGSVQRIRRDPFSTHCQLLEGSFHGKHFTEAIPTLTSETEAAKRQQEKVLLEVQVLWKQRCCDRISKREGRVELARLFKQAGLTLFRFPTYSDIARNCIQETKSLRTKHLARTLQTLINGLHYMGQVLWSAGCVQVGSGTTLPPERLLSRRMFALEKSLQMNTLQAQDFVDWIASVKRIALETASLENIDIRQGQMRLSKAIEKFDTVHNELVEISTLLSEG